MFLYSKLNPIIEMNSIRVLWPENINRDNWEPTINSKICSLHFKEDCFQIESKDSNRHRKDRPAFDKLKLKKLLPNAVPTIFPQRPASNLKTSIRVNEKTDCARWQREIRQRGQHVLLGWVLE